MENTDILIWAQQEQEPAILFDVVSDMVEHIPHGERCADLYLALMNAEPTESAMEEVLIEWGIIIL
jgi:hypothetical protein